MGNPAKFVGNQSIARLLAGALDDKRWVARPESLASYEPPRRVCDYAFEAICAVLHIDPEHDWHIRSSATFAEREAQNDRAIALLKARLQ